MSEQLVQCHSCGRIGEPKIKGSIIVTIVLLLFWFVPGIIYEIWRRSSGKVCTYCSSENIHFYYPQQNQNLQQSHNHSDVPTKLVAPDVFSYNAGYREPQEEIVSETKECPYCAETIRMAAIKCKHCNSMLE